MANERLRLELQEQRAKEAGPDPRLGRLERENAMLCQELATVRAELETFETGVRRAVAQLEAELEV